MPTVMITGARRGIGRGLTERFLAAGWQVVAAGRDIERADLADQAGVMPLDMDVADEMSIRRAAERLGGWPLDLLVNNAGVFDAAYASLDQVRVADWQRDFAINAIGPVLVTRHFLTNLRAGRRRHLAVISSTMGSMASNTSGAHYAYRSSKAAANAAWVSLARDLGPEGFVCVTLCPGWVRTDMGGPGASLSVEQSTAGLFRVLDNLQPDDNGRFVNYAGETVPW